MRSLSDYEKSVIRKVSEINASDMVTISRFFSDNLFSIENGIALVILPNRKQALLYLRGKKEEAVNRQRISEFLELVSLIDYLRSERYIHNVIFSAQGELYVMCKDFDSISIDRKKNTILNREGYYIDQKNPGWILNKDGHEEFEGLLFSESQSPFYQVLESIISSPLAPTQELKEFVRNRFRTKEEIRHSQNIVYTRIALGIAILFGILGTVGSVRGLFHPTSPAMLPCACRDASAMAPVAPGAPTRQRTPSPGKRAEAPHRETLQGPEAETSRELLPSTKSPPNETPVPVQPTRATSDEAEAVTPRGPAQP